MERDTQRSRVYKADDVLRPYAKPLPTVDCMQSFVRKVWKSRRLQASYPKAWRWGVPTVYDGRGRRSAGGWSEGITMPLWSRKTDVVIHELAHTISHREYGSSIAGHGWEFASVYLRLVLLFMGREVHDELKASFRKHRVRYTAPRKRKPMDPEKKAQLVARLAAYREQKRAANV